MYFDHTSVNKLVPQLLYLCAADIQDYEYNLCVPYQEFINMKIWIFVASLSRIIMKTNATKTEKTIVKKRNWKFMHVTYLNISTFLVF